MNRLLSHRGPDDEGYIFLNDNKIFRLAGEDTNHSSIILHALENFRVKKYKRDEPVIGLTPPTIDHRCNRSRSSAYDSRW